MDVPHAYSKTWVTSNFLSGQAPDGRITDGRNDVVSGESICCKAMDTDSWPCAITSAYTQDSVLDAAYTPSLTG